MDEENLLKLQAEKADAADAHNRSEVAKCEANLRAAQYNLAYALECQRRKVPPGFALDITDGKVKPIR